MFSAEKTASAPRGAIHPDRPSDFLWVRLVSGFPVCLRRHTFCQQRQKVCKNAARGRTRRFDRQSHFRPTYSPVYPSAAESIQVLAGYAVAEAEIENLVTAKGYADCVAFMGDESISVVVDAGEDGLQPVDVARISEIVLSETDYTTEQIKVLEAN